jgi:hypothetical protein
MNRFTNSFLLSLAGLLALLALGLVNKVDVSGPIAALVASYVTARGAQKASHVWAASRDADADTTAIISRIEGK